MTCPPPQTSGCPVTCAVTCDLPSPTDQQLDLCKSSSQDADFVRGKVILSLLSRDGHGGNSGSHNVVVNTQGMISALSVQVRGTHLGPAHTAPALGKVTGVVIGRYGLAPLTVARGLFVM